MAFQTNAGATFGISAAAPAAQDEASFEALTFVTLAASEITDYQGPNPEWSTTTDNSYSTAGKADQKATRSFGECNITAKYDIANTAFWDVLDTAEASKTAVLSVQFAKGNGVDYIWYTAQVKKGAGLQNGGAEDFETREIILLPQTDVVLGTA